MTKVYQIVQHTYDKSVYISFQGCNFQCKGCYLKDTIWYYHLPEDLKRRLQGIKHIRLLSLSEFESLVKGLDTEKAILGGAEPTLDEELPKAIRLLSGLGIETHLTTNGYILNRKMVGKLEEEGLSSVCISIRAYNDYVHRFYTGRTNRPVLDNFKLVSESGIEVMAESILIPGLVELDEIERIARFIADIDPSIPYRIDGFMPFGNVPWHSPSPEEVVKAVQVAKRYLENVHCVHKGMRFKGEVINIYPEVPTN
ncbi:MAG: radical SAM protein [Candidatus Freyarchaeota archaeon]